MRVLKALVPTLLLVTFVIGTTEAQEKTKEKDGVFFVVEEMPEYPGGPDSLREFIANNVKYPVIAQENGIQGKVYVTFVVDTDGSVTDSRIARGVDPVLDKEALRVINSMATWTPGKEKGKPVKVSYTVPINFALNDQKALKKKEGDVYFTVEEMPLYPGGDKALRKYISGNVKYPEIAQKNGIQGKVYVTFVVDTDGSVADSRIARGVDPVLDKEALRVINSMATWTPGKEKGKPVKVSYTVPINFALNDQKEVKKKEGDVYFIVEEMPLYPGGDKALREYISSNVKYPEIAQKNGIEGKVYVTFVVDTDGSVSSASIARGVDPSLDKEALRVVNTLPTWTPGKDKGKTVKVSYTVPINFALK